MLDLVSRELAHEPQLLEDIVHHGDGTFTTGDVLLDQVLGGGIRTRMLWELFGERCVVCLSTRCPVPYQYR